MEKIRKEIDEQVFAAGNISTNPHFTISAGLINFDEVLDQGSEEILKLVDGRLLKAKSLGRNRIVNRDNV